MKKLMLTMLMGMMALGAMAEIGKFTVRGTFEGREDTVAFILMDAEGANTLKQEVHPVTGEMLEMSYYIKDAALLYVLDVNNGYKDVMIAPAIAGETLEYYYEDGETLMRGSQFYLDYAEAEKSIDPAMTDLSNFISDCRRMFSSGTPEEEVDKLFEEKYPVYHKAFMDALTAYVKAHPDQDAAAALVAEIAQTQSDSVIEEIEATAALLTERARNSNAAGLYKASLEAAKKEAEEEARKSALEGSMAPDFTLNDINGNPLALSSLRGKWVIIDFWGSWCGWCIKGFPKMKEYYAKYNGKMEILGVDCNDTVEKWKAAVAKHELPWLHVYMDMEDENGDNPLELYVVEGFPTKVVVDPEGKVAKIIVGESASFYDYLDEVLK